MKNTMTQCFQICSTSAIDEEEEENAESKEIIEDQLVTIISKDYLDVFSKHYFCMALFSLSFLFITFLSINVIFTIATFVYSAWYLPSSVLMS